MILTYGLLDASALLLSRLRSPKMEVQEQAPMMDDEAETPCTEPLTKFSLVSPS